MPIESQSSILGHTFKPKILPEGTVVDLGWTEGPPGSLDWTGWTTLAFTVVSSSEIELRRGGTHAEFAPQRLVAEAINREHLAKRGFFGMSKTVYRYRP